MRKKKTQADTDSRAVVDEHQGELPIEQRVREAMKAGLRAITADEVAKIDGQFSVAQRILLTTYSDFPVESIPADLGAVLRDLRIYRDRRVDELTFRVSEDFRLAMRLVEWALQARQQTAPCEVVPHDDDYLGDGWSDADSLDADDEASSPDEASPGGLVDEPNAKPVDLDALLHGDGHDGLTKDQKLQILRTIAQSLVPVRTSRLALDIRANAKTRRAMLSFLKHAHRLGAVVMAGNTFGRSAAATKALKAALA